MKFETSKSARLSMEASLAASETKRGSEQRHLLVAISDQTKLFFSDESGRGLATYGFVLAGVLLIAGVIYGLFVMQQPPQFTKCQACGMG